MVFLILSINSTLTLYQAKLTAPAMPSLPTYFGRTAPTPTLLTQPTYFPLLYRLTYVPGPPTRQGALWR